MQTIGETEILIDATVAGKVRRDGFHGIEFIQTEDPDKAKERLISEFEQIMRRGHRG